MENGTKALNTGMVFGRALIMIVISENGTRAEQTGMEFTHGPMVTGTRVNGTSAWSKATELIRLQVVIHTLANTTTASLTEKANILGKVVRYTSVSFGKDWNTAEANGGAARTLNAIVTMESMRKTREMAMASSNGQVETLTKDNTRTTSETDTELWNGLTAVCTKVNGRRAFSMAKAWWSSQMAQSRSAFSKTMSSNMKQDKLPKNSDNQKQSNAFLNRIWARCAALMRQLCIKLQCLLTTKYYKIDY